jgi:hypothetical protein
MPRAAHERARKKIATKSDARSRAVRGIKAAARRAASA